MNKERAINVLLDFAKNYNKDWYAVDKDGLTSAIIFLEQDIQKNKKDAKNKFMTTPIQEEEEKNTTRNTI